MSKTSLVAAAYSVSPTSQAWVPEVESKYYQLLKNITGLQGLEHPFFGELHQYDDDWFLHNIDPNWNIIFTGMPGVMNHLAKDANFGIASDDHQGRQNALNFYKDACKAIRKLNSHFNKQMVPCIQIHTSPSRKAAKSSTTSLSLSLQEMQSWDWSGAKLVIEHCDAFSAGGESAKGFLTLEEEIEAVTQVNLKNDGDIGFCVNWGRSAIETHSVEGPLEHIKILDKLGLLNGLMFSGVAAQDPIYGDWKDSHMPPCFGNDIGEYQLGNSLLNSEEITNCNNACNLDNLNFMGAKISLLPRSSSAEVCAAYNAATIDLIRKCSLRT